MVRRTQPLFAAGVAVSVALLVALLWWRRPRSTAPETALDGTLAVRFSRHDALGIPSPPTAVRDRARARAIVEAVGVDVLAGVPCPPDYASADVGMLLSGRDAYARRNVYVWNLFADAGSPSVIVSSSEGCRGGRPADENRLRELLLVAERDASP